MARSLLRGQGIAIYDSLKSRYPQLTWSRLETVSRTAMLRDEVFAELGITVLPGARDVMQWTAAQPRALVTGSSRVEVTQVLPLISERARFEIIVAAEDVPRSQPAPA